MDCIFVISSVGIVSTSGSSLAMQNQKKSAGSASALLGVLMLFLGGIGNGYRNKLFHLIVFTIITTQTACAAT